MKAIGFKEHLSIQANNSLIEFSLPKPQVKGHDLLVKISAVSVNPVDVEVRRSGFHKLKQPKIIGWDAVGEIVEVGTEVTLFHTSEKAFYAGSFIRPGSNSEFQLVDERITGHAPKNLSDAEIAAMPLTSLTTWEALFEQLAISTYNKEMNHHPINLKKLTKKRANFAWEWMYSKSFYQTPDIITQHQILEKISQLLDQKIIHSTLTKELSPINVNNLKKAR